MAEFVSRLSRRQDEPGAEEDPLFLERWKLLDWRFLLPDPQPRKLGYGGAVDPRMAEALRLLDPGAARIAVQDGAPRRLFEVVLLLEPDARLCLAGAEALIPGGWICILCQRSFLKRKGPRTLLGWQRLLQRQGLQDVSIQWYAPTLDLPSRIVPVGSRTAVLDTLRRHKGVHFGKTKQLIGRAALDLGLFAVAVPEGAVTGRRPVDAGTSAGKP